MASVDFTSPGSAAPTYRVRLAFNKGEKAQETAANVQTDRGAGDNPAALDGGKGGGRLGFGAHGWCG